MNSNIYIKKRIKNVRDYLNENNLDALLVSNPIHLFYLTNYKNEDGYIVITKNSAYYLIDARSYEEACNKIEVIDVKLITKQENLKHYIEDLDIKNLGYEANHMTVTRLDLFKKSFPKLKLKKTKNVIEKFRVIKDEYEISQVEKACQISKEVYNLLEKNISSLDRESDVSDFYFSEVKAKGAQSVSFPTIVANGKGSSIPHYSTSDKSIDLNKITLMDFGCVYNGYCSDCTRVILPPDASDEIQDIYLHVKKAKQIALDMIKDGVDICCLDKAVRDYFESQGLNKYFTHSLGHSVGLEVHDGLVINGYSKSKLISGMIITIEPGIYLPNKYGIRLEDTVLVKKNGHKILT